MDSCSNMPAADYSDILRVFRQLAPMMKILFFSKDDNAVFARLKELLPEADLRLWPDIGEPAAVDYAVVWGPPPEFFDRLNGLKAILSLGAGVDHLLQHPKLPAGVPIIRLEDAGMADKIAEYVLYGVLRSQRLFAGYEQQQRDGIWQPLTDIHAREFRVGVMGLGAIGLAVAKRLQQNGYQVSGWRRRQTTDSSIECHYGDDGLQPFLSKLNVLVCLLPLTPATTHIINRDTLAMLPRGAHLINVARGAHVAESDLLEALENGQVASALLDVCSTEPAPPEHPFWNHPAICLTPHIAGPTQDMESARQIADSIIQLSQNQRPGGWVDMESGY